jgi:hypothetical protein
MRARRRTHPDRGDVMPDVTTYLYNRPEGRQVMICEQCERSTAKVHCYPMDERHWTCAHLLDHWGAMRALLEPRRNDDEVT